MKEYSFKTAIPGDVAKVLNDDADQGWEVEELYKEGPKFWILMSRSVSGAVLVTKKSPPKKAAAKKKAAAPKKLSMEEQSASKE